MHEGQDKQSPRIVSLSQADADRLDARLEAGPLRAGRTSGAQAGDARDQKLGQLLAVIGQWPADEGHQASDALVRRTMDRIREAENRRRFSEQMQMLSRDGAERWSGGTWRQVATMAAIVLIGASLLLPVLARNRDIAERLACQRRLNEAYSARASYAGDHNGHMPRGKVEPGSDWWHVGQPADSQGSLRSNSAHLYLLVREGYLEPENLACPSNPQARPERMTERHHDWPSAKAVSYSYQNQYTDDPIKLDRHAGLAVLADKNPLFVVRRNQVTYNADWPTTSPSRMHEQRGQNVLIADGHVKWNRRPIMQDARQREDNIWIARGIERYQGNETPRDKDDSFLVP